MKNQRILVAGGTGFIGSHTAVELLQAGFDVVIVDDLSNSSADMLTGIRAITGADVPFVQASCADPVAMAGIFDRYPDIVAVINFAASKAVNESVKNPGLYYRNNLNVLLTLLEQMKERPAVKGLVFSSSCTVYGEPDANPVTEQTPIKPATSPYGNTKQISEEIIRDFTTAGVPFRSVILRYFNPIGAHPSALIGEMPNGVPQNLIPYLTQTAIGIRPVLNVFGDDYSTPDGTCIRDFIDVNDLARAHVAAVRRILQDAMEEPVEVFNVGTGEGVSVRRLIDCFREATGVEVPHRYVARREGDIEQVWADPSRANNVLGWKARVPLSDTLASAWRWQKALRERGIQ